MKMCSFGEKHKVVIYCFDCLKKLIQYCEGLKTIHYELMKLLMKITVFVKT